MSTLVSVAAAVLILAAAAPRPADAFVAPFGTLARRGHGRAMAAGRRPYGGASLAAAAGGELTGDDELLLAAVEEESGMLSDMDLFGDPEREREESLRSKQQAELVEAMEACLRDNDTVDIFSDGVAAGGDDNGNDEGDAEGKKSGSGSAMAVPTVVASALKARGIESPTPIQRAAASALVSGDSAILHAETVSAVRDRRGASHRSMLPFITATTTTTTATATTTTTIATIAGVW